jgi:hypothetical protein
VGEDFRRLHFRDPVVRPAVSHKDLMHENEEENKEETDGENYRNMPSSVEDEPSQKRSNRKFEVKERPTAKKAATQRTSR